MLIQINLNPFRRSYFFINQPDVDFYLEGKGFAWMLNLNLKISEDRRFSNR